MPEHRPDGSAQQANRPARNVAARAVALRDHVAARDCHHAVLAANAYAPLVARRRHVPVLDDDLVALRACLDGVAVLDGCQQRAVAPDREPVAAAVGAVKADGGSLADGKAVCSDKLERRADVGVDAASEEMVAFRRKAEIGDGERGRRAQVEGDVSRIVRSRDRIGDGFREAHDAVRDVVGPAVARERRDIRSVHRHARLPFRVRDHVPRHVQAIHFAVDDKPLPSLRQPKMDSSLFVRVDVFGAVADRAAQQPDRHCRMRHKVRDHDAMAHADGVGHRRQYRVKRTAVHADRASRRLPRCRQRAGGERELACAADVAVQGHRRHSANRRRHAGCGDSRDAPRRRGPRQQVVAVADERQLARRAVVRPAGSRLVAEVFSIHEDAHGGGCRRRRVVHRGGETQASYREGVLAVRQEQEEVAVGIRLQRAA